MTPHIAAAPDDIADTVLMPGDPRRAAWAAKTFLSDPVCVKEVRGMLGFTGTWRGHRVTIQASGMGMPSLAIYATELMRDFGVRTIVRTGSAGAIQPHLGLRDIVIAMSAASISTPSRPSLRELILAPCADWGLLSAAVAEADARGLTHHVGQIQSADAFYDERPDLMDLAARHGVLAVEMEAAELYTLAARHGASALAILTISDHLPTGQSLSSADRETSFSAMLEVALRAATA